MSETHVAICMIQFVGPGSWARGNAQWIKDNTQVLAAQAALVDPGGAGERTSYCIAAKLEPDGTLSDMRGWYLDDAGVVRQGVPENMANL